MKREELKLKPKELQERVQAYLKYVKENPKDNLNYPLNQFGLWGFVSGWYNLDGSGCDLEKELYEGKFIDAVVKLAKKDYFFHGDYKIGDSHGGHVELIKIKTLPKAKICIDDLIKP
jgi:hypothetical protein